MDVSAATTTMGLQLGSHEGRTSVEVPGEDFVPGDTAGWTAAGKRAKRVGTDPKAVRVVLTRLTADQELLATKRATCRDPEDASPPLDPTGGKNKLADQSGVESGCPGYIREYCCPECLFTSKDKTGMLSHVKTHAGLAQQALTAVQSTPPTEMNVDSGDLPVESDARCEQGAGTASPVNKGGAGLPNSKKPRRSNLPKIYSCAFCPHRTADRSNLHKHVKRFHSGAGSINERAASDPGKKKVTWNVPTGSARKGTTSNAGSSNQSGEEALKHTGEVANDKAVGSSGEQKEYLCEYCPYSAYTKARIREHTRTHTGEKPFKCPTCPKTFAYKGSLHIHKRIHTGVKPYKCPTCSRKFAHRHTVIEHGRTHTGEKPFECPTCFRKFTHRQTLTSHKRTHKEAENPARKKNL